MKFLKTVLINLLLFIFMFHVVDYYASLNRWQCNWFYEKYTGNKIVTYLKHYRELHNYSIKSNKHIDKCLNSLTKIEYDKKSEESLCKFRPIENEIAQKSIILFGCSFAYGDSLNTNETFSAMLGELLSNYRIYNKAKCCWTTSHMLYQLENNDFSNIPNVKLVIYVFINDHFVRNYYSYMNKYTYTPYYKLAKNRVIQFQEYSLKYIDIPILYLLKNHKTNIFYNTLYDEDNAKNKKTKILKKINLTKNIIEKSKKNSDLRFQNSKFIVLRYDYGKKEPYDYVFEELKKEGIVVVSLSDFSDKNYMSSEYQLPNDHWHPNARAWKEITPLFVKYLKDNKYLND